MSQDTQTVSALDQRIELDVSGMTCAACANRIERKLNKIEGVRATVNYATERAVVTGLASERAGEVVDAVRAAGYDARPVTDGEESDGYGDRVKLLRNRLIVAALITIPLGDAAIALALAPQMRFPGWQWVLIVAALPVVFWCAWPFHRAAWRNLRHGATSMDTLVSLGVLASFTWSVVATIIGGTGESTYWFGWGNVPGGADSLYLEAAAGVTTFLLAGRYVEARSKRSARGVLTALGRLAPTSARVIRDGVEQVVPIGTLAVGERFVVRPGERIATDGRVLAGASAIDASAMTGEPEPVEVAAGSRVLGGTTNTTGALVVEAEKVGAHTQLAQLAVMAEQAQARKASVQTLVDKVVAWFVPAVLGIAVATLAVWLLAGGGVRPAFNAAMSVLIIACPCALGLATPTALLVGVGRGGQLGILIKGPGALESSGEIDTVVLDKTGTLTTGTMTLTAVHAFGRSEEEVLALAAAVEQHSEHPVAAALVTAAQARGIEPAAADEVTALPGHGVRGLVGPGDGSPAHSGTMDNSPAQVEPGDGSRAREVVIGSLDLMETRGLIVPTSARAAVAAAAEAGRTAVLLAIGPATLQTVGSTAPRTVEPSASPPVEPSAPPLVGPPAPSLVEPAASPLVEPAASPLVDPLVTRSLPLAEPRALPPVEPTGARPAELVGALEISDVLKDSAPDAVARLRELGLHTVLLTGDRQGPAELIGQQVGVDEVIAEVLPAEKAAAVEHLQQQGRRVAMVGDGINDAAALATANLGMAVVSGTDVAMKSADIILVRRSLDVIPDAIGLARRTLRTIRGNLVWAFGYNVAAIPLAALGYLNPLIAGLAMSLSSIFVVTNSMRLRRFTPPRP